MTDAQRKNIEEYRRNGIGYKKIGKLVGVSENTVKTYCRRNGLGGIAVHARTVGDCSVCKYCGSPITQTLGRKARKFCSDRCRNRWWNTHLDLVKRKANYEFVCPACRKTFTADGNAHRKYCSHECYIEDRFGGWSL